ncbi:hypothetical protein H8959_010918 [Pygathrix nigripes]
MREPEPKAEELALRQGVWDEGGEGRLHKEKAALDPGDRREAEAQENCDRRARKKKPGSEGGTVEMASLSRPSLPSCLCSFLLLLLLQVSSSYAGQFRVIGPRQPIRALVGDEVELPCRISPGKNATGMEVGWYRPPFSRVVHLYRNGKDQDGEQAPEYRGRTELLKDAIGEGKVTLRIRNVRFSDEGGFTCFFRDHSYQEEAAMELKVEDPFYWVSPGVLVLLAVLPVLLLQITVGLVFLCLQYRLRDPHFLRVPCWKITLFVIVPVLGPLVALIICYNWLHRRLAGAVAGQQARPPNSGEPSQL